MKQMNIGKFVILSLIFVTITSFQTGSPQPIIDSNMSFGQAIHGTTAPKEVVDSLCLIDVRYYSLDGKLHQGQLVVHVSVREDVIEIFKLIEKTKFTVKKVIPIVAYQWSDNASMEDNNTSAFNYRNIAGTDRLSNHAFGMAVDINPEFNPVVYPNGETTPEGAFYKPARNGTFHENQEILKEFKKRGWRWGGNFNTYKDYHHFDKLK